VTSYRQVATAVAIACVAAASAADAQSYPAKPLRMIVASSAGSNPDTIGRVLAQGLTQVLSQQVVVDDRAGAGGNIGAEIAAKAPADGYSIFLAHTNHSINAALYRKLNYDIHCDFSPVTLVATSAFVAAVHPSVPAKTVRDLINIAKARPGDLNFASAGTGSGTYFSVEYFNRMANVKMVHIGYVGGGPALTSVLAGETSVYFTPLAVGLSSLRAGRLRALGVTSLKRVAELPDVPPVAETLPGYEMLSWAGLMVPAKTPKEVSAALHKATLAALARPDVKKRYDDLGFTVAPGQPEEMVAYVKHESEKYAKLVKALGMPLQ
jgi:tripartite-type tricarboxylate transporter receptor subunit TctC